MTIFMRVVLAGLFALASGSVAAGPVAGQGTWETTLQPRDLNGDGVTDAFYDTDLNITWLRDANVKGMMNWGDANTWAAGYSLGGYYDWRLPTIVDTGECARVSLSFIGGSDCGYNVPTATSEMAHLFYLTLGNKAYCDPVTSGTTTCVAQGGFGLSLTNTGDFENMQSDAYWSGTEYVSSTDTAWAFFELDGYQIATTKTNLLYAFAVRAGDVLAIPEPGTLALLAIGLAGLVSSRRLLAHRRSAG